MIMQGVYILITICNVYVLGFIQDGGISLRAKGHRARRIDIDLKKKAGFEEESFLAYRQEDDQAYFRRPKRRRPERKGVWDSVVGVSVVSLIIIAASFGRIDNAFASYAPSSAAVTSQLPARKLDLEELENLNPEKAIQRERALGKLSVSDLLSELEQRLIELQNEVEELENIITLPDTSPQTEDEKFSELRRKLEEQRAGFEKKRAEIVKELIQKRKFEEELRKRAQILEKLDEQPAWFNYAAAAGASVVSTIIMHPIDTIKTRLQSRVGLSAEELDDFEAHQTDISVFPDTYPSSESNGTPHPSTPFVTAGGDLSRDDEIMISELMLSEKYQTTTTATLSEESNACKEEEQTTVALLTKEKETPLPEKLAPTIVADAAETELSKFQELISLYAGVSGNIAKEALPSALYLGVYEAVKATLLKTPTGAALPLGVYLLAGGAGELCGSVLRAPAEAVKSLVQSGLATDFGDAVRVISATDESKDRVFRAWSASVIRDVPMGAIQICIFEALKLYILNSRSIDIDVNTLQAEAAIGAVGGLIGAIVTTPMDIATTRIITADDNDTRGAFTIMREILQESGPLALFSGSFQRALYWAPAIGIFLSTYCSLRQYAASDIQVRAVVEALSALMTNSS